MNRKAMESMVREYEREEREMKHGVLEIKVIDDAITAVRVIENGDGVFYVPNFVECIGEGLFKRNEKVREVRLPNWLKAIEKEAFCECGVRVMEIPDSVEYIGERAFFKAEYLKPTIPKNIQYIGIEAYTFTKIEEVRIDGERVHIMRDTFSMCKKLRKVYLGRGLKEIGFDVFIGCSLLDEVEIEDGTIYIGKFVFHSGNNIRVIKTPKNYGDILRS